MNRAARTLDREAKKAQLEIERLERTVAVLKLELAAAHTELAGMRNTGLHLMEMAVSIENGLIEIIGELDS
jgi:hypothetical protein